MDGYTPEQLFEQWCDYCLAYKLSEFKLFANGHHYEEKKLVLHLQTSYLCLECGHLNIVEKELF